MKSIPSSHSELLENYNNFQECILSVLIWKHYLTALDIVFNQAWDSLKNLKVSRKITLRISGLQSFHIVNHLTPAVLKHPEELNWGFNEVALVKIEPFSSETLVPFDGYKLSLLWESERRIEITAAFIEVFDDETG